MANAKKTILAIVLAVGTVATSAPAADTIRWKGEDAENPNDWNNAASWSAAAIPTAADNVVVNAPPECEISGGKTASAKMLKVGCGGKSVGAMSILDADSSLTASSFALGGYGGYGKGVFTQSNGTVTTTKGLSVGHGAGESGYGKYHGTGGSLTVGDALSIGAGYLAASQSGNGGFHLDGVAVLVAESIRNGSGTIKGLGRGCGTINITAGSLGVGGSFFNSHHMWAKDLPQAKKHLGRLTISGGSVNVTGNFYNGFGPDPSRVEGVLEVVGAGGKIAIGEDFTQIQGSTLVAELAGKDHTVIRVKGNVTLGGVFKVRLAKGYTPPNGTWWDIIQADPDKPGSPIGTFSKLDFSATPDPGSWKVRYDTDDCVFRVGYVPEK